MRTIVVALSLLLALLLLPGPGLAQETPRTGGVLKAAMIGEPPLPGALLLEQLARPVARIIRE
jgi:hypothetical protein